MARFDQMMGIEGEEDTFEQGETMYILQSKVFSPAYCSNRFSAREEGFRQNPGLGVKPKYRESRGSRRWGLLDLGVACPRWHLAMFTTEFTNSSPKTRVVRALGSRL
jgi:hypothetical protein